MTPSLLNITPELAASSASTSLVLAVTLADNSGVMLSRLGVIALVQAARRRKRGCGWLVEVW